ncbi:hypothetical protein CVT25_000236 [Psilocybe cyanescens]|uniref:Uncharacterized protein n=1 Tax=Psilocybe cyanescens TaxID=93625 RepID=A0A409WZ76_PSICY|nr:hypothetical protein CVT25_000236 [Psilocybe cyanescens]
MAEYNVNADCTPWFNLVKQSHQLCCLPLYNINKNLDTKPETWETANSQCVKTSNTFSVKVESPNFTLANGNILTDATVPVSSSADSVGSIMLTSIGSSSGAGEEPVAGGNVLERAPSAGTWTRHCGQDEEDHADVDMTGASPAKKSRQ